MFARSRGIGSGVPLLGALMALLAFAMANPVREAQAQMSTDAYATKYFLDEPPTASDLARLPANARAVVVAKVRVVGKPHYLIERDRPGQATSLPNDLFIARLEIIDVLRGSAAAGGQDEAYFGVADVRARYVFPHTQQRRAREYFVVSYIAQDGARRLFAFEAGRDDFEQWEGEFFEYVRPTGRAFAGPPPTDCLSLVYYIDRAFEVMKMTPEAAKILRGLRNKGEALHKAGLHPECLYPLIEWF